MSTARIDPVRFDAECAQATVEMMGAALRVLAGLFLVLAPINALTMPAVARAWCALHDLALVGMFLALASVVRREVVLERAAPLIATFVPLAILSNTILAAALGGTHMPEVFVALVLVGVGSMYLVTSWLIVTAVAVFAAWTVAAIALSPTLYYAGERVMVGGGAAALGFIVHGLRRAVVRRVAQLRAHDALRQEALEAALVAAHEARASLDLKVAARTEELARARDALAAELAERNASEERRRGLERSLAAAQRMEAVGRLAGGVAHDFNNLLMVIGGHVELFLDRPYLPDDERADLQEVMNAVGRASRLIRQLLALGRRQVMQTRRTTLGALVGDVRRMIERILGADIRLVVEGAGDLAIVADQGQLEQVIVNLVLNARDAMPGGGTLTLRLRRRVVADPRGADLPDVAPGDYAVLDVIDTGHGMDARVRQSLFEPFFTTKSASNGSGLGLAAVLGIVAQHGGFVDVDSTPGVGSAFSVHLPMAAASSDASISAPHPTIPGGGHETVLVVEDEPAVRRLAADGLTRLGYKVLSVPDGDAALRTLESTTGPIDLMVTDVIMPGMDGVQLVEHVRDRWPATRVLFMSGYAGERLTARGLASDDKLLLHKPFTLRELSARVRELLDQAA